MKKKSVIALICAGILASQSAAFAMSTRDFDKGMAKGISYFNRGLYYEAKDEFTWFKDYNYSKMNSGQQKYLDDYLNGTWNRIYQWEEYVKNRVTSGAQAIQIIKNNYIGAYDDSRFAFRYNFYDKGNYYLVNAWVTKNANGLCKYRVYKNGTVEYIGVGSDWSDDASESFFY